VTVQVEVPGGDGAGAGGGVAGEVAVSVVVVDCLAVRGP